MGEPPSLGNLRRSSAFRKGCVNLLKFVSELDEEELSQRTTQLSERLAWIQAAEARLSALRPAEDDPRPEIAAARAEFEGANADMLEWLKQAGVELPEPGPDGEGR
jgi:hypothetical protein